MSTLKITSIQNLSGVEQFLCKAWVNFNGSGTVSIRASGNVSSITDNATNNYTVNFTSAMPNTNYATIATASMYYGGSGAYQAGMGALQSGDGVFANKSTSSVNIGSAGSWGADPQDINLAIFC